MKFVIPAELKAPDAPVVNMLGWKKADPVEPKKK